MSEDMLRKIYRRAESHAGIGDESDAGTVDDVHTINGASVHFQTEGPEIYYNIPDGPEGRVYVDDSAGTGPIVTEDQFVNLVLDKITTGAT